MLTTPLPLSAWRTRQPRLWAYLQQSLQRQRMGHAYLLLGTPLLEAQQLALSWVQTVLCVQRDASATDWVACGRCRPCGLVARGQHPDVYGLHAAAPQGIGLAAVRQLQERLRLQAVEAPLKVVCLAPACSLQPEAQQALLKSLEEPPGATLFLLLSSKPHALLATLRSRCQRLTLQPPTWQSASQTLQDAGIAAEVAAALACRCSNDVDMAQQWASAGAAALLQRLLQLQQKDTPLAQLFAAAQELAPATAGNALPFEMAVSFLELLVRNAMAQQLGVVLPAALQPCSAASSLTPAALAQAAQQLQRLRQQQALHPSKSLVLTQLLLTLRA